MIDRICAATPAACGVAMDVPASWPTGWTGAGGWGRGQGYSAPEIVLVASSEPDQAALISRPGAKMSMQGP